MNLLKKIAGLGNTPQKWFTGIYAAVTGWSSYVDVAHPSGGMYIATGIGVVVWGILMRILRTKKGTGQ